MWTMIFFIAVAYFIGFFLGRKYEKDILIKSAYGILETVSKDSLQIESLTYYYTKEAYNDAIKNLKEMGEDYYEQ